MMKSAIALSGLFLSFQAFSMGTQDFANEFLQRLDENIATKRASNSKYCESFKKSPIYSELSYASEDGQRILYFDIQNLKVGDFLSLVDDNFECYGKLMPSQQSSLLGAIANSGAYKKDRKIVRETLDSMAVEKVEFYKTMGEVFGLDKY